MGGKMRPCTVFCADSNEVNHYITNAKSGQTRSNKDMEAKASIGL